MKTDIKAWIEAMRLRTLPVSVAGVVTATGYSIADGRFRIVPAMLCLLFAILAQVASNFANEYYDFRDGLDRPGRDGPRRGVTEGDITPSAMKRATFVTLGLACMTGLGLVIYGGWWLIAAGIIIGAGAMAYSTGPYPLSRHGLGELAVIFFFGIIPVNLTYYVQTLSWSHEVLLGSIAIGLMGANVLMVNNYRDADDDRSVGKHTLAVLWGRRTVAWLYLLSGWIAVALMITKWETMPALTTWIPAFYTVQHTWLWIKLRQRHGAAINPLLGATAMLMLAYAIGFTTAALLL